MIDVRTLLFANAVVFTILAIAMLLVWRGNRTFPGLATLARVHAAMIPGAALIGLPPRVVPAALSALVGNALMVLSLLWLLEGIRELYSLERGRWPRMAFLAWGGGCCSSCTARTVLAQVKELSEGQARRLCVRIELAPLPQARLRADPQRLQQILVNLISNAVRFSPAGQTVRLRAFCAHGMVRIEVNDSGPGIPRELQSRIFQRFARGPVAGPSEEQARGSGLGLAISKALVEGMGRKIGFETGEQTGTMLSLRISGIITERLKRPGRGMGHENPDCRRPHAVSRESAQPACLPRLRGRRRGSRGA